MTEDKLIDFQALTANKITSKLNSVRQSGPVTEVIELLLGRIVGAGNSLRVLRENAPHDFAFDGAMILRGIYDAMLQGLYILEEAALCDARAQLYLDYFWVEKKKAIDQFDLSSTAFGKRMSQSPRRVAVEPAIEQEIQRALPQFFNSKKKPRDHWYEGSLRNLAQLVRLESEYELLQKNLSGVVHSSAYALKEGMTFDKFLLISWAFRFSYRLMGKFAEYAGIILDDNEAKLIRISQENIFD